MYTGVKVPNLEPTVAKNYEIGGWMEIVRNKLTADISAYRLISTNEIVSVKLDDGSLINQNAGETSHRGIKLGVTATPVKTISIRWSGAYSIHRFVKFEEKGDNYNRNEMNGAPNWIYNTEVWYRPAKVRGLRIGAELQFVGDYYADPKNTAKYGGYTSLNIRIGYEFKNMELWMNAMNVTDNYYANFVSRSAYGYSYNLADPRSINLGFSYNFGNIINNKK